MRTALLFLSILALPLLACDSTGPGTDSLEYSFTVREIDQIDTENPVVTMRVDGLRIILRGQTWTACAGGAISGEVSRTAATQLHVAVSEVRTTTGCTPQMVAYEYTANIGPLANGRYTVTVTHSRADNENAPPQIMLTGTVDI
jgi:hypothetical protein